MISLRYAANAALASYSEFISTNPAEVIQELLSRGFALAQANQFLGDSSTGGALAAFHNDALNGATGTGFHASVFRYDGNLTVAVRGTEGGSDYITDSVLAVHGAGFDQLVAMYNWWQRATASADQSIQQVKLVTVAGGAELSAADTFLYVDLAGFKVGLSAYSVTSEGKGELFDALASDPDLKVDVTGHSLGGHLAMGFAALFPNQVSTVTTFNAPGFKDSQAVRNFFSALNALPPTDQTIGAITTNVAGNAAALGDESFDLIAGLHSRPGLAVNVAIEDQLQVGLSAELAFNHSQKVLTDAVAVLSVLQKIDPTLTPEVFRTLMKRSSNVEASSLESLVYAVSKSLNLDVFPVSGSITDRHRFYELLTSIENAVDMQGVAGLSLRPVTVELTSQARTDFSAFLALYDLSPYQFGQTSAGWLSQQQQARPELYAAWLAHQDPAAATKNFSESWFTDRAALLRVQGIRNDGNLGSTGVVDPLGGPGQATQYQYRTPLGSDFIQTGAQPGRFQRPVVNFGSDLADTLTGTDGRAGDRLYGGMGHDKLYGRGGADRLEGGAGNDILEGGGGQDTLIGGQGIDTYVYRLGDGNDVIHAYGKTIEDRDYLHLEGILGSEVTYKRNGNDLYVNPPGGIVVIKDWFKGPEYQLSLVRYGDGSSISGAQINDRVASSLPQSSNTISQHVVGMFRQIRDSLTGAPADSASAILTGTRELSDSDLSRFGAPVADRLELLDPANVKGILSGVFAMTTPVDSRVVVIGLDGTSPGVTAPVSGAKFDFDGNGFREATSWASPESGILVQDVNGNGAIDSGVELIAASIDGAQAPGRHTLQSLDSNQDGVVDSQDASWTSLRVWADSDENGVSAPHELLTMEQAGIASISTSVTPGGVAGAGTSVITRSDGSQGTAADVALTRNPESSTATQLLTLDAIARALPNVQGMGDLHDLQQAMMRDSQLKVLTTTFKNASWDRADGALEAVLLRWTGAGSVQSGSRGPHVDARQVAVLERFYGQKFAQVDGLPWQPSAAEAAVVKFAYAAIKERVLAEAMIQTHLSPYFSATSFTMTDAGAIEFDFAPVAAQILALMATDPEKGVWVATQSARAIYGLGFAGTPAYESFAETLNSDPDLTLGALPLYAPGRNPYFGSAVVDNIQLSDDGEIVFGQAGNDVLTGGAGNDYLSGGAGADTLRGGAGDDLLDGGAGNDILDGGSGRNTLRGGAGDDILTSGDFAATAQNIYIGGTGNDTMYGTDQGDTYYFRKGDGQDTIYETANTTAIDILRLGQGIDADSTNTRRIGNDLVFMFGTDGADQITVKGWFADAGGGGRIERIEFADGTVWTGDEAAYRPRTIIGTDRGEDLLGLDGVDDVLYGRGGNDNLFGYGGNDRLYGEEGNDYLNGGAGNDYLSGGPGDDQLYGMEGDDILEGGDGNDILNGGSGVNILRGGAGDDTLSADDTSENTFEGGTGNDTIYGSRGADLYLFDVGDGRDVIIEGADNGTVDVLRFGPGIVPQDINVGRVGRNLVLSHTNGLDSITVQNWYSDGYAVARTLERIEFADGTVWFEPDLTEQGLTLHAGASGSSLTGLDGAWNRLYGAQGNDVLQGGLGGRNDLFGGDGNDTLYAGNGATNVLDGGAGDDILYGSSSGSTTFIGGAGNDMLRGTSANDLYLFNQGDGQDTIVESRGSDTVRFGAGIVEQDWQVVRHSRDLVLLHQNGSDRLTITDWFASANYQVERFEFADGTILTNSQLTSRATVVTTLPAVVLPSQEGLSSAAVTRQMASAAAPSTLGDLVGAVSDVLYGPVGGDTPMSSAAEMADLSGLHDSGGHDVDIAFTKPAMLETFQTKPAQTEIFHTKPMLMAA